MSGDLRIPFIYSIYSSPKTIQLSLYLQGSLNPNSQNANLDSYIYCYSVHPDVDWVLTVQLGHMLLQCAP